MTHNEVIAAFDFDGTLTTGDSLLPFLIYVTGSKWKAYAKLFFALPSLMGFILGLKSRQSTKETVLKAFIKDMPFKELKRLGEQFAFHELPKMVIPQRMERVKWHQSQGHRCILISANIEIYLGPWAKQVKFDDLLCSKLEFDNQQKATGRLQGLNCWGPEKTRRLQELLGKEKRFELYAYGDSRGDKELLLMADHGFKLKKGQGV